MDLCGAEMTVLVVDDHPPYRRAMRDLITQADGFTVVGEAATGEAAIDMVAVLGPGLVLMDVDMPGIGGIEAARAILQIAPRTRVVLCSTYEYLDVATEVPETGAVYLRKEDLDPERLRRLCAAPDGFTRSAALIRDPAERPAPPAMP